MKRLLTFLAAILLASGVFAQQITPSGGGGGSGSGTVTSITPKAGLTNTPGSTGTAITTSGNLYAQSLVNTYTGSHTVTSAESAGVDVFKPSNGTDTGTFTLPQSGTTGFESGTSYTFLNTSSGNLTITTTTSVFIGVPLTSSNIVLGQYGSTTCTSDGTNWNCEINSVSSNSGTVTSVTFTGDGLIDSSTPSTAVTTSGTVTATLKTQTANTIIGAATTTLSALAVPSCSAGSSALQWVTGTGFQCGTISSGAGGGMFNYSGTSLTALTAGTYFVPIGGGTPPSGTEANVSVKSPSATTVTNLQVSSSVAIGAGNTIAVTLRDASSSQSVTCTISGASATTCQDLTHSFNVAQNDIIDWQVVTTGTVTVTPTLNISANNGTSNVGITNVTATSPVISSGGNTPVIAISGVTAEQGNGAKLQLSTGSTTTNDCVKFDANGNTVDTGSACGSGGGVNPVLQPASYYTTDTAGNLFPYVYTGGGGNASASEAGWGVVASLASDVTLQMRFQMPPSIPSTGTFKLISYCQANATSGVAKYTPSDADVAAGSSPSAATLTADTQVSNTWTAADVYVVSKTTLSATPLADDVNVVAVTFNHTGWTLGQIMNCRFVETFE